MIQSPSQKRIIGFIKKESWQMVRDPSCILIGIVLPLLLMFLYGYGVSLDMNRIHIGLVLEDTSTTARDLASSFVANPYFNVTVAFDRRPLEEEIVASKLRGMVVIPQDFSRKLYNGELSPIQVIADGTETNTANFVNNYSQGVVANWLNQLKNEARPTLILPTNIDNRVWFNPELESRNVLLPGSIAIIMSLIGTLLTALVIAREWERGTMEAMMATPIHIREIIIGKLTPYFLLGLASMTLCVIVATVFFGVPFRGSFLVLLLGTSAFLFAALGQGLLISTAARNQFVASQLSLIVGFLPAFMLSGFIFEINSMPLPIQFLTYLLPPRYFVTMLQTSFLAGVVWQLFIINFLCLLAIAGVFLFFTARRLVKRLD